MANIESVWLSTQHNEPLCSPWEGRRILMEEALGLRREETFSLQHTDEKIIHLHYSSHSSKDQNPLIIMMMRELIIKAIRTFIVLIQ